MLTAIMRDRDLQDDGPGVYLNPADAADAGLASGDEVEVSANGSSVWGLMRIDPHLRQGTVAIPHGFAGPNPCDLTGPVDEFTGMPQQTAIPVVIRKVGSSTPETNLSQRG
jgi:anaerobic selenocysteine-containing dehydrogenase